MKQSVCALFVVLSCIGCDRAADESVDADAHAAIVEASADGTQPPAATAGVCGRFEVSGAVEHVVDTAKLSEPRLASHGGWDFSLHDDGYVLMLKNVPIELAVGDYPFAADMPSTPHDWDWETPLNFPLHVVLAERSDTAGFDRTWDDDITGMLTVEAIEDGRMTGQFEFTDGSIKVLGSFCNVEIPASADMTSAAILGESTAHDGSATATITRMSIGTGA